MHHKLSVGVVLGVLLLGSSAFAVSSVGQVSNPPSNDNFPGQAQDPDPDGDDLGRTGGAIERFQRAGACDLVDVSGLAGNWTHGSYVSAVAALGDPALVPTAAHSDCGKPTVSVGHGNGPPEHALEKIAQGGEDRS